jgi:hypothetical protein
MLTGSTQELAFLMDGASNKATKLSLELGGNALELSKKTSMLKLQLLISFAA